MDKNTNNYENRPIFDEVICKCLLWRQRRVDNGCGQGDVSAERLVK